MYGPCCNPPSRRGVPTGACACVPAASRNTLALGPGNNRGELVVNGFSVETRPTFLNYIQAGAGAGALNLEP